MKVFLTGATGIIGEEVAYELRRNGFSVLALVRNIENNPIAQRLIQGEIQLFKGSLLDTSTYKHLVKDCDIIIHCAVDYGNYGEVDNTAVDCFLAVAQEQSTGVKKRLLYTSGIMSYKGQEQPKLLTEEDASAQGKWLVDVRIQNEQKLLTSPFVDGCVIRPGWVFGKRSGHFVEYFLQPLGDPSPSTIVVRHPQIRWSEIHVDDLVHFYLLACECTPDQIRSQKFNVADKSNYTNMEIARAFTSSVNWNGELIEGKDDNESEQFKFRNRTVLVSSDKATKILGWKCKHKLMLDDVEILRDACLQRCKNISQ